MEETAEVLRPNIEGNQVPMNDRIIINQPLQRKPLPSSPNIIFGTHYLTRDALDCYISQTIRKDLQKRGYSHIRMIRKQIFNYEEDDEASILFALAFSYFEKLFLLPDLMIVRNFLKKLRIKGDFEIENEKERRYFSKKLGMFYNVRMQHGPVGCLRLLLQTFNKQEKFRNRIYEFFKGMERNYRERHGIKREDMTFLEIMVNVLRIGIRWIKKLPKEERNGDKMRTIDLKAEAEIMKTTTDDLDFRNEEEFTLYECSHYNAILYQKAYVQNMPTISNYDANLGINIDFRLRNPIMKRVLREESPKAFQINNTELLLSDISNRSIEQKIQLLEYEKSILESALDNFCQCPLTLQTMSKPVIAEDGNTYEQEMIRTWIEQNSKSPITRQPLRLEALVENTPLKMFIDDAIAHIKSINDKIESLKLTLTYTDSDPEEERIPKLIRESFSNSSKTNSLNSVENN